MTRRWSLFSSSVVESGAYGETRKLAVRGPELLDRDGRRDSGVVRVDMSGTCLLVIDEQERELRAWDLIHCPAGTKHAFMGTGDGPCVIFIAGARRDGRSIVYPRSRAALAHGAGVEAETPSPAEAYARFSHWRVGRPDAWPRLPWA